ncbi:MAG: TetM/TetW/TetO/TetS family tetracycline resistance ribosomal protection protein [Thermoflexaceae bacterium]|nr:TetM/TetW/TetO/TetS family tetracycline resistance ribosomal protection protein [Thermoflexaceae bacterium]
MKRITAGILAHVDAGKTTLSEAFLYLGGAIRNLGRVDLKNTVLDTYETERARGITIFSKQAQFVTGDTEITLLDTPGHVDFAAEMERTLQVLDYAILVISGANGVQGHTRTLWKLLMQYDVPVFLFVNKMDQPGTDKEKLLLELREKLDSNIFCFQGDFLKNEQVREGIALCDEELMEQYLLNGLITDDDIRNLIARRKLFPCFFGSALKLTGVEELMAGLDHFTKEMYEAAQDGAEESFGAKVYKISRDNQGNRLTHLKVTSGRLAVKALVNGEKVNQIRIYQGEKFETVNEADCGMVCVVTGLNDTCPGQGIGVEKDSPNPLLQPVLNYRMIFPKGVDARMMYGKIRVLGEEDPQLHVEWNEACGEVTAKLMGEVQTEILKDLIKKRFDTDVDFADGSIVYKETIKAPVIGVGHYEPLRHYAEVQLLLEPADEGSGMQFATDVSEDILDRNWQRLVLTHLKEKEHIGVLTGSPVTDMKITLINGRAHLKHTEGGDFRQAVYRAVRQGLMKAESVLLEPYYEFSIEIPADCVGRALTDLDRMKAVFTAPEVMEETAVITGTAPVSFMNGYQKELAAYTRGMGSISLEFFGYRPCVNDKEVISRIGYEPLSDMENPSGSVFCAHGAGFVVDWAEVEDYMHLEMKKIDDSSLKNTIRNTSSYASTVHARFDKISYSDDKELQDIFRRTYGETKKRTREAVVYEGTENNRKKKETLYEPQESKKEYLLVDGYNVLHANEDLKDLLNVNLEAARNVLMDVLCNYQGYRRQQVILVFDAYKIKGNPGEILHYNNIDVVYTKEAETADRYIERTAHEIGHRYDVTVVTSDGLEQVIIRGAGCRLMSSREFWEDVVQARIQIHEVIEEKIRNKNHQDRNYLFNYLDEKTLQELEQIRIGKKGDK